MNDLVTLDSINKDIINCTLCNRLVQYTQIVGKNKVKRFSNQTYWSKPVTGFGDPNAKVLIIGLAPAAHGANRTGRLFTGDHSGQWLVRALYEMGFSNIPTSTSSNDGLNLKNVFITSCIRCAPPSNKPLPSELSNCSNFLKNEIELFKGIKIVITLGSIAFQTYCKISNLKKLKFRHLADYQVNDKRLIVSYHPSLQNTNTKKLTWAMWIQVFKRARSILDNN
jgi:uracil-DNA glycosylase family 4